MLVRHFFNADVHAAPYEASTILKLAAALLILSVVRSTAIAGSAYIVFWKVFRERWHHRRIQQQFPSATRLWNEFKWSLSTFTIYAGLGVLTYLPFRAGYTRGYQRISDRGWGYFVVSLLLLILLHDAYFYWTHRLLHLKPMLRHVHRVHHESTNPSPWAAFSFHPIEAVLSFGVVPLALFLIPLHLSAIALFFLFMTVYNVLGHLGYELYPSGSTSHWLGQWSITSTHHNIHHRMVHCNYGLYFSWWDRLMRSNHAAYHDTFEGVVSRPSPRKRFARRRVA